MTEWDSPGDRRRGGDGLRTLGQGLAAGLLIALVLWISMTTGAIEQSLVADTVTAPTVTPTVPRSTPMPPQQTATMPKATATPVSTQMPQLTPSSDPTDQASRAPHAQYLP